MSENCVNPDPNCQLCPRLAAFRSENKIKYPDKFNAPVPSFGDESAKLLIVGLAPGLKGANFSGRPFTGDFAGELLYGTLLKYGLAKGEFKARPDDGLELINARITNAVRCLPPENKPLGSEINTCMPYLKSQIETMPNLKVILSLGLVSHNTVLKARAEKLSAYKFAHNATHDLGGGLTLIDSYHCSKYNTSTKRLTEQMFHDVFKTIQQYL
ncbi:MAG: uracil-DNA glycosylase [Alphaproteobacteria bacterium]|nr:uracil-DNA glycosylase [Alphaproteobacteria bacterium]NCQ89005.1 uracil-DNA glycosylase [Alphaproteobacteria bacterium]NCT07906.1 uracil-DNA glycosylase [Alphaproteobacteria bacterium]